MTNVLLIYEHFIPSVKLCAYDQLNYLHEQGKITLYHCCVKEITKEMCIKSDIVFFIRSASILEKRLASEFKKQGKLLIYSIDDDLLNVPDNLSSSSFYRLNNVKKRIVSIMKQCDYMITPSPLLAKKYGNMFKKYSIIEEPCSTKPINERSNQNNVKIGFAGSIDRAADINNIVSGAIRNLISKYGDRVTVEFMGAEPEIVKELNLTYFPYEDNYDSYKKRLDMLNWDIGLAPLPDTLFHNRKHYNKFIEYSSANIVGVYSKVQPYTRVIQNEINGILCDNTEEAWVNAVSWLIDHNEEREAIRDFNNRLMIEQYSIPVVAEHLYTSFDEISFYKAAECSYFPINKIKFISIVIKLYEFVIKNGIRSPWVLFQKCFELLKKRSI